MNKLLQASTTFTISRSATRRYQSASQKLFEDAEREENDEELRKTKEKLEQRLLQDTNWTGEEKTEDTVLRMLVDKHKPLRTGFIQTADEKIKANPPKVRPMLGQESQPHEAKDDVILPGIEGHKPWMTTYKTPSFAVNPSIRVMRLPPQPAASRKPADEGSTIRGPTREERARMETADRVASAREKVIDYRFAGISPATTGDSAPRANPKTMQGWRSLVEERIEEARNQGAFKNNLLLNNLVKRNGASPPWVELQRDLDSNVATFRNILRSSWVRRVCRHLPTTYLDPEAIYKLSPESLAEVRDAAWEQKERAYHEQAIKELNSLVRRYNAIAPYSVRRGLHVLEQELERCYSTSGEIIYKELRAQRDVMTSAGRPKSQSQVADAGLSNSTGLWAQLVAAIRSLLRA
ncbi:hypothetical protein PIIN_05634 [Serendipita indica DSM 11827]|uniref:DnaJ homologue subfamily C member 28 conserved domain-containing protein n=1 Tax=Serendipita indica (strain DSM 11827) TaxID=1109443 RepID=G4TK56_SERID|nr:hypothetical protein PIIN_05634 [Serendipita indica DSM 11827]